MKIQTNPIFVLDCSLTMMWCFADQAQPKSDKILHHLEMGAIAFVPSLWSLEVGNVLVVAERRKLISINDSSSFLTMLNSLSIHVDDSSIKEIQPVALGLARQYQLSLYDATYLELALRKGLPIATMDKALSNAAVVTGINLFF